jgi:hypothetical protein
MVFIAVVEDFFEGGLLKYILIGLVVAGFSIFNEKQNLKLKKE